LQVSRALWSIPACGGDDGSGAKSDLMRTLPAALGSAADIAQLLQAELFTVPAPGNVSVKTAQASAIRVS
jgi:hypothetical protein